MPRLELPSRAGWIWLGVVILLAIVLTTPVTPEVGVYRAVTDGTDPIHRDNLTNRTGTDARGDHALAGGKLYLRIQATRHGLVLLTFVERTEWTAGRVREFRDRHPELEAYWPDPKRPDGGVVWLQP